MAVSTGSILTACKKPDEASKGSDGGKGSASAVIKVGEFASLTGKEATFGQSSHKGTLLAIEELNAAGGVLGRKFDLITEDTQSKQGESASVVRKLISRDKVIAVLGEVASGRSLEAAPICQNAKVPMISPSSTNPKVTEVRVCFIDPFQGTVMALFAKNTLKAKNVAVLTDAAAPYSVGLATFFKEKFVADGGKVSVEQKFSSGDKDFKAQLTAIKAANPDAIFAPCYYTEAGLITQQARQLGDKSANQFQPITAAIKRKARLCSNAKVRQVAWRKIADACGCLRLINIGGRHIWQVRDQQVKVRWVAWCARREERFGEIAVHEGDARGNTGAQCIGTCNGERLARDVGCGEPKRRWRFRCNGNSDGAAPRADLRRVQRLWCATERARC